MKANRPLAWLAVGLAVIGSVLPQRVLAAPPAAPKPAAADVALQPGGVLLGMAVTAEGAPAAGIDVVLERFGRQLAAAQTDDRGCFAFRGVTGGAYELAAPQIRVACRVWQKEIAPPAAQPGALVVVDDTVRGQMSTHNMRRVMSSPWPWIVAGVAIPAIVIPFALDDDDDEEQPASP